MMVKAVTPPFRVAERTTAAKAETFRAMRESNTFPDGDDNVREQIERVAEMLGRCS